MCSSVFEQITNQKKCQTNKAYKADKVDKADKVKNYQKVEKIDKIDKTDRDYKPDMEAYKVDNKLNLSISLSILSQWLEIFINRLKTISKVSKHNDITIIAKSDQETYKAYKEDLLHLLFL